MPTRQIMGFSITDGGMDGFGKGRLRIRALRVVTWFRESLTVPLKLEIGL